MHTIVYNDDIIFVNPNGSFTGTVLDDEGDVVEYTSKSLDQVKHWIDIHTI